MLHRRFAGLLAGAALAACSFGTAAASAAPDPVPSFSRCPAKTANILYCIVIKSTGGSLTINNTAVPIADSLTIEGGIVEDTTNFTTHFVPPTSGSALTAKPVTVPGGLLGIPLPLGFDTVKATPVLVGAVQTDLSDLGLSMPIRIKLENPLLGSGCTIGTSWMPIRLKTTTGTTSPPAPATPITGKIGETLLVDPNTFEIQGNVNVDNAFSVPIALDCGYLTGILVTTAVNLKLGLPSPAGRNTAIVNNNIFIGNPAIIP